ncbi:hypothetical protein OE88DRAFT_1808699 [Heliocybe sulcata]|uniref:Phospholipid/glycerol acyltransferase domain-containing protein n=1 Tax=Heliocybe sulcata TaxID=5364 RepID=A0A5C3MYR9_9AGAM|nr:hypothetical protein OE88DRAFT_1808699 [Heliocybe sulcata]
MELKLVYRVLRKISDWALSEFYSEVYVEGQENVPQAGPLIVVASHHNEIIDIATLAATIPHRRPLCFWAKSTMFKNPLSRAILTSSGTIPVHRNPDSASALPTTAPSHNNNDNKPSAKSLFASTSETLSRGEVVGVFPEGTSYTEPRIVQVKEGAAWAAVEYVRWSKGEGEGTGKGELRIVPVGIVYTDKARFRSRVCVRYGEPVDLSGYTERILSALASDEDLRSVVRELTMEIEERMVRLTINAPDWDMLYISRMIQDIQWPGDRDVPLPDFVPVSQRITNALASSPNPHLNQAVLKYYSLLRYIGLSHSTLSSLLPSAYLSPERAPLLPSASTLSVTRALRIFVSQILITVLHPRFMLFVPPLMVHIPAYVLGNLAARLLATKGEEEGIAQYKVIVGGLGRGIGLGAAGAGVARFLKRLACTGTVSSSPSRLDLVRRASKWMLCGSGWMGRAKEVVGVAGVVYLVGWALVRWHNALVDGNYRQWKKLRASYTLFAGLLSSPLPPEELAQYYTPPPPVVNPFIKRREPMVTVERAEVKPVRARRLVREVLVARREAEAAMEGWSDRFRVN